MITPPPVIEKKCAAQTSLQKRGRAILAVLLISWLIIALGVIVLEVAIDGISPLLPIYCVRYALTLGLFYAIWTGHNWARWLTVGLFAVAFLLSVRHLIIHHIVLFLIYSFVWLAIFLIFTVVLTLSKSVGAFLSYQRSLNSLPPTAP
jgi:hypothetical protein